VVNKAEESRLADLARRAHDLRECISAAESMLRAWKRHKPERERWVKSETRNEIYVSLADRRTSRWHTGVHMPADVVERELLPVLKDIRDKCIEELRELPAEIKSP